MVSLSVITINFNGVNHTLEMLKSLRHNITGYSFECIVLDNGSANDESVLLKREFPEFDIFRSDINLGFAGGNNLCIARAKGKYLLFINNDTIFQDNSIVDLISFMDHHSNIGACSPKILFNDPPDTIQFAGFTDISRFTLRNSAKGFMEKDNGQYDIPEKTFFLHGAAMIFRRDVIDIVGPMPEEYFLYYEEMDWSESVKRAGFELWYIPISKVIHKESSSIGAESPQKKYYITRNRLLFAKRNRKRGAFIIFFIYFLLIACTKDIIIAILKGRINIVFSIICGCVDFINSKYGKRDG
ncbi:MAG: glycosyltransferase family 2 protein [Bacteroidales bacterium]|nr:glycosyltransferase family 2 protein [Bacteroidales bacterium]MDD4058830.1 glycosyltransferase family 2 protein [Bacteroidales bacterium]